MSGVTDQINAAANATAQYQAAQPKATGAAQELGSQDFLNLMMKQLQYQDPMEPVGNTEFIAQQAQFTQLETTQEMSKSITENNAIMQTLTLVGKDVVLTDPTNSAKTITGTVSSAKFTSNGAAIEVGGEIYPISLVQKVTEHSSSTSNNNITSVGNDIIQNLKTLPNILTQEIKNIFASAASDTGTTNTKSNT